MSRHVDDERTTAAIDEARKVAKARINMLLAVLAHWDEGLQVSTSATRLEVSISTVARARAYLGLRHAGYDVGERLRRHG